MRIKFFTAGGTIDKVYFDALSKYEVGNSNIDKILKEARVNFDYEITSLLKKDSLEMTDSDRHLIYNAVKTEPIDKIIITHGTDTMVETAKALQKIQDKTIILTGSMEPSIFKTTDAIFNIGSAIAAVQTLSYGVYISISGRIFTPDNVKKNRLLKKFEKKK